MLTNIFHIYHFNNQWMLLSLCCAGICLVLSSIMPLFLYKKRNAFNAIKTIHTVFLGLGSFFLLGGSLIGLITGITGKLLIPYSFVFSLHWLFYIDRLANFFLFIIGLITFCSVFYLPNYLRKHEQSISALLQLTTFTGLFVLSMSLVVLAHNLLTFMASWEMMSLTSYFLVTYQHQNSENRQAGFIYLIMAHLSGLLILSALAIVSYYGHSFDFSSLSNFDIPSNYAVLAFVLAFMGFGMKAGIMPLHVWLPQAHPVAPSHISALMSGVMLKIAVYGFVRFVFTILHQMTWQEGICVLLLGSFSALLGVLYAINQQNLKRLLAYSSIENIGIIFIGLGLAIIFYSVGLFTASAISLLASLYHCFNHAIFKSLLFLGAGAISQRTHEHDLERMGGLIHRMPYVAISFLIGCLSIASLPLFNGFVSEWLTLQAILQVIALKSQIMQICILFAGAILVLTSAIACACFVKVFGIAFLGKPRSRKTKHANCIKTSMHITMISLASLCVICGLFPTVIFTVLNNVIHDIFAITTAHLNLFNSTTELNLNWNLNLILPTTNVNVAVYAPLLWFVPLICCVGLLSFYIQKSIKKQQQQMHTTNVVRPWDCGFGALNERQQYTSTAFAMPIRRVFRSIWRIKEEVIWENNFYATYKLNIIDYIWHNLYLPLSNKIIWLAKHITKIQSGNVRAYLAYMFFTLIFLLWLIA